MGKKQIYVEIKLAKQSLNFFVSFQNIEFCILKGTKLFFFLDDY